ncbi:UdgX family uracil-DNA binding protein [Dactylosporangium fulvum]|uniref:Type-4 uracil-DNA glycosylase n=1 Tax=Dactylosporangium fulvum TaxID=53359 RepID=A0ABY5W1Y5_9ACTN|nr:UdgX family uracil-DNA binding protein [Dactylosporangium fulvum]UWP83361.1 UdgX family uracil-DNA binding protein [Dactylosporangium fulvum]
MTAAEFVPDHGSLDELRTAVQGCRGCGLYQDTTQAVFGEGPEDARILVVGEQPGDVEDRRGRPFVGPAGKVLDRAFAEAGLDRTTMYLTNAVKHFKHRPAAAGKRRLHQTPDRSEIVACRPWLVAEFEVVRPAQVVALGATAAKALLGPSFRVTKQHGVPLPWPSSADRPEDFNGAPEAVLVATIHPSAVLRADDREAMFAGMVEDLKALRGPA